MSRIALLLLVLTVCNACTLRVRQPDPREREQITSEILALTNQVLMAAEQADADRLFALHSTAIEYVHINNGTRLTRDQLVAYYKDVYSEVDRQEIEMGEPAFSILSKDAVIVAWEGQFTTYRNGGSTLTGEIAWTHLWKRTENGWKLFHAHHSLK